MLAVAKKLRQTTDLLEWQAGVRTSEIDFNITPTKVYL
jgi:hypothetical protein